MKHINHILPITNCARTRVKPLAFLSAAMIAAALLFFSTSLSLAQNGRQERRENIESMKIAFITKSLELTPDEAKVFWPVYNQYESEMETLRSNRRQVRQNARGEFSSMTDAEAEKLVDGEIAFRQSELDIQKKYHTQFKKVLPVKKVAMLYRAEEAFKQELLKKLQESRQGK